jgi:hypothetical protein
MRVTLTDGRQMTGQMLAFDKVGRSLISDFPFYALAKSV